MPNVLEQILEDNLNPPTSLPMPVFRIADKYVEFADCVPQTYLGRSEAIQAMLRDWRQRGLFIALRGWREECFEVACHFDDPNLFRMERSATFLFGIRKYGVDINGYVRHPLHGICIWLQKRAVTKQTWPDKWDNIVGGGLSTGYTVLDTACKEAQEEATIPMELLKNNLKPVGTVSYFFNNDRGLSPNTEFVFDLELPLNFKPSNSDGEVDEFNLVTAEEALRIACGPDFKTTSCPVIIDFMIRHGLITEESEPNLLEVKKLFNVPLETFYYRERKSDVPSP
jgi:8-oxo-dGTP pyrophosphatase MutT (NUDIX family)